MSPHESVRPATPADLDQLTRLAGEAAAEKRQQKGGAVWARRERRADPVLGWLQVVLDSADHEVVLGLLDGVTVGYGVVRVEVLADGGKLGIVEDIFVEPAGRELGLGEMLMEQMLDWSRQQGCFGVDSLALPGDRATKNFFESFGLVARAIVVHRSFEPPG